MKDNLRTCFRPESTQWLNPVLLTAAALQRKASSAHVLVRVLAALKRLSQDDYSTFMIEYLERGLALCGDAWGYCDLLSILCASAELLQVENYLEIGVRRGRSLGMVVDRAPYVNAYGFDLWVADYAGMPNPGEAFVRAEMERLHHQGRLTLVSGDSKQTVPAFLAANPDLSFDLITIDGDHSAEGARADLVNALPRLRVGGVLVMDDVVHPQHAYLRDCWAEYVGTDPCLDTAMYTDLGYGVACAVRVASPMS